MLLYNCTDVFSQSRIMARGDSLIVTGRSSSSDTNAVVVIFKRLRTKELYPIRDTLKFFGNISFSNATTSGLSTADTTTYYDESSLVGKFLHLDFQGAGVTATQDSDTLNIVIPGSGSATITVQDDDVTVSATISVLDFQTGFDAAESPSGEANITVNTAEFETLLEPVLDLQDLQGAIIDAQVPNNITIDLATLATTVTITDNESTAETNAIVFLPNGDLDGGNLALESDGDLNYNPSSGTISVPVISIGGTSLNSLSNLNTIISSGLVTGAHTTDTNLDEEEVEDFVGGMVTGNTETRIAVTYVDGGVGAGILNFVVDDMNDDIPETQDLASAFSAATLVTAVAGADTILIRDQTDNVIKKALLLAGGSVATADITDVSVTQTELAELETIGATTISANQWALIGGVAETLGFAELNLLDGITVLSGSNTGDDDQPDDNTELPNMAQNTIKMRVAAGTGDPEDIDISTGLSLVTAVSGDFIIIEDATDGNLRRADAGDFLGGGVTWDAIGDAAGNGSIGFGATEQIIVSSQTSGDVTAFTLDINQVDDAAATDDLIAFSIDATSESGDAGDTFTLLRLLYEEGTANTILDRALLIDNAETTTSTMTDAIQVTSSGVSGGIIDAIDVSDANIVNAINIGANLIVFSTGSLSSSDLELLDDGTIAYAEMTFSNNIVAGDIAVDAINLLELDDGADTPLATEFLVVATGATDIEYLTQQEVADNLEDNIDHDNLLNFVAGEHIAEGSIDHGSIAGLGDDDHTQYAQIAAAENISGVWEVADDIDFNFGTDADWSIQYDEAVDNQLIFETTATAAIAITDPMFQILVGTTPTANQQVFGIARGTQASNTDLFTLDEDGDAVFTGTIEAAGYDVTAASDDEHFLDVVNTNFLTNSFKAKGRIWVDANGGSDALLKMMRNATDSVVVTNSNSFSGNTETGIIVTGQTDGTVDFVVDTADLTTPGIIEIATIAETNTGTDPARAVSPDGLDGWTGSAQIVTLGTIATGTVPYANLSFSNDIVAGDLATSSVGEAEINWSDQNTDSTFSALPVQIISGTFNYTIFDTVKAADSLFIAELKYAITIDSVVSATDAGTVTFQLDHRGHTTRRARGTNIMTASLVADAYEATSSFSDATIPANRPIFHVNSAVASSARNLWVTIFYTIDQP